MRRSQTLGALAGGILFAGAALFAVPSGAVFISFEQWMKLTAGDQATYIAGAFDSLVTFGTDEAAVKRNEHYEGCLIEAQVTSAQLAEGVRSLGSKKPELQAAPVQAALIQFLFAKCGAPPDQ